MSENKRLAAEFFGERMRSGKKPILRKQLGTFTLCEDPDNGNLYVLRFAENGTDIAIFGGDQKLLHTEGITPLPKFTALEGKAALDDYVARYGAPHFDLGSGRDIPAYLIEDFTLFFLALPDNPGDPPSFEKLDLRRYLRSDNPQTV